MRYDIVFYYNDFAKLIYKFGYAGDYRVGETFVLRGFFYGYAFEAADGMYVLTNLFNVGKAFS